MAKISVLIPDGESTLTKHVVHCLSVDKDIKVHILSKDPNANIRHSRLISSFKSYDLPYTAPSVPGLESDQELAELIRFHHYDSSVQDQVTDAILRRAAEIKADVIFPVDEHIIRILANSADKISKVAKLPPLPDFETFTVAIDKWKLAGFLDKHDVPHPKTIRYSAATSDDEVRRLKFPVIIKPTNQGNAMGIELYQDPDKLLVFLKAQKKHEYILQPFIKGYDIDCSLLALNGKILAYTIQKGIVFSEIKFRAAVGIEFVFEEKVIRIVEKMMKLMNWSGVAHIDLRYDQIEDMPKVLEINARYWGSLLGSKNAGVNFPLLAIKTLRNETFEKPEYKLNRYFMGKSPIARILKSAFKSGKEKVGLFETSLPYSLRDPVPSFFEILQKLRKI
ncbi:MAG TPA: ATP-grasp domain-containing protein [Cyclobacteriaceae bacterium]|nr:ATP-grasp domain-containing protein [Cyclobacteriaceae bacterium]